MLDWLVRELRDPPLLSPRVRTAGACGRSGFSGGFCEIELRFSCLHWQALYCWDIPSPSAWQSSCNECSRHRTTESPPPTFLLTCCILVASFRQCAWTLWNSVWWTNEFHDLGVGLVFGLLILLGYWDSFSYLSPTHLWPLFKRNSFVACRLAVVWNTLACRA